MTGERQDPASPGAHSRTVDGARYVWEVCDLWRLAAGLPVVQVAPADVIDLERDGWFGSRPPVLRLVLEHMRRIQAADLCFPVILAPDGSLMDGAHRVCRALLEGRATIPAVRFESLPEPSRRETLP